MVDRKTVEYIANLARIKVKEEEIEYLRVQLSRILDYVDKLKQLNVDNVPVTRGTFFTENILREDEVKDSKLNQEILRNSPYLQENHFKIPKVIE
ncbi:MAG: Asp-tRNA(Asn)/Glu-tRNA(Gln) amidotransferase subunit GatB [Candidatus Omnitrophota bacterium]|nr:Asp-tRNA(Asn)/Glu-tRNA(Gln) amidotransferase subunit GatC [Candidatus Omnitrophota bacterium]RKY46251.1 MAG: Asp-tRNA(Asn)/Glu-tRNA(Gln) amidotransferase subunit GatB [Candidatus Omnitrophota bacterium]